ncbi:MAG: glycosyl transferase, partial [Rhodospirillaceae bacterium]
PPELMAEAIRAYLQDPNFIKPEFPALVARIRERESATSIANNGRYLNMLPRVPLVHGFCLGLTREVIDRIGAFDVENFLEGHGEAHDYCFRAIDAGFSLVIATHTYIFYARSGSYADAREEAPMKVASETLERLHGHARIRRAECSMEENPILMDL